MSTDTLTIGSWASIPASELSFRYSRAGGPGGQNVNRSASRVELLFDVANSPSLTASQKKRIQQRLGKYLDTRGTLHLVSQSTSSQLRNREDVTARLVRLLTKALTPGRRRVPTRPTANSRRRRLEAKRRRSRKKKNRQRVRRDDW